MIGPAKVDGREVVFWTHDPKAERLYATTVGAAVEEAVGHLQPQHRPATLELIGYARRVVGVKEVQPLEWVLESLDEEYAGDDFTAPTPAMKEAERVFAETIIREYVPWACEEVTRLTVDVREWTAAQDALK